MGIEIKRILLPTDFSTYSATATNYACALATKFDAELHLLHTLEVHLASTPGFGMGLALPQYVHESRAAAEKALRPRRNAADFPESLLPDFQRLNAAHPCTLQRRDFYIR